MRHRKTITETVFYDSCGCTSSPESKARRLRNANEVRARSIGVPR